MSLVPTAASVSATLPKKRGWRLPGGKAKLWISGAFLAGILLMAILTPLSGIDPDQLNPDWPTAPPWPLKGSVPGYWLGTDDLGRDLLSRIAMGARISLLVGVCTAVVSVAFGTLYGALAAFFEGKTDTVMMRLIDVIYALPTLMIVILFSVFMGRGVPGLVLALALFSWPDTARIIRGQILGIKREEFVEAFHSLGGHAIRLIGRHFIPNTAGLIVLTTTMTVPRTILTESTLSFIGLGVEPPLSSWGTLASEGWQLVRVAPHMLLFPAMMIFCTMITLNLLGDALREIWDPDR